MFNFTQYIQSLTERNKLVKEHHFHFGTCSGINSLQGAIQNLLKAPAFLIADTVTTGGTIRKGGSYYQRRTFTFFVIKRANFKIKDDQEKQLEVCREIRRQFLSRILHDQTLFSSGNPKTEVNWQESNVNFDLDSVASTEYADLQLDSCCGLYVMINADEPISLAYEPGEWN